MKIKNVLAFYSAPFNPGLHFPRRSQSLRRTTVILAITTLLMAAWPTLAQLNSRKFRYSGRVTSAATVDQKDFRLRLFDSATGGVQLGSDQTFEDVQFVNQQFTLDLDFGASTLFGGPRWLEIATRAASSTGPYDVFNPRQEILAVPQAVTAQVADRLANTLPVENLPATVALLDTQGIFTGSPIFAPGIIAAPPFTVSSSVRIPYLAGEYIAAPTPTTRNPPKITQNSRAPGILNTS